ncbi:unnamed protein product [Caenorhabditis sp. 36 PRJEB53466]|nr:unnamed protein product [Caenorhabditis sp. 36 PRJEB53466]
MDIRMEESINGDVEYQTFHYYFTFSTVLAVIPFVYMTPTLVVMLRIFNSYRSPSNWSNAQTMNHHIFVIFMLYFLFNTLFFFADFLRLSLPATGILTSWCARIQPNHFLKLIFYFTFYFNYCILILPFLLCLVRLVILLYPTDHPKICPKIMKVALPALFIIPFFCTAFMIPSMGYCRKMGAPLMYGAVYVYYSEGWFGWRNSYIHLVMSVVMCSLTIICSVLMLLKLRSSAFGNSSTRTKQQSHRAETSLSITMISSIIPFINNTILTIVYLTCPDHVYYLMIFRPFGNDCETIMMPWILYLTHPMFRQKRLSSATISTIPLRAKSSAVL